MTFTGSDMESRMRDALRLYEGDTRVRDEEGRLCPRRSTDPFWGDEKAYRTLNTLLYPGTSNEFARICRENGKLNPIFARQIDKSVEVYCDIFRLMCRGRDRDGEELVVRRVERKSSLELLKQGQTVSFFSASKAGYSQAFAEKDGVVLLEIHVAPHVPCVDFEEALGEEYKRREEREVLLPPFVEFSIEEAAMDGASRKSVRDMDGGRPLGKYEMKTKGLSDFEWQPLTDDRLEGLREDLREGGEAAAGALQAMNRGEWQQDFSSYVTWKSRLREYLKHRFFQMWRSSISENEPQQPA